MVVTATPTCAFSSRELSIQDLPEHHARMRTEAFESILFSLPQHMHDFVRGIKVYELVGRTRYDPVLSLKTMQRSKK